MAEREAKFRASKKVEHKLKGERDGKIKSIIAICT